MKNKLFIAVLTFLLASSIFVLAKENMPDPLYLNSDVLDYSKIEKTVEKPKDPRTLNEKIRAKLHLPPTKKIYYHNIDRSNFPVTMDDYFALSAEKKRNDFEIPQPSFEQNGDVILPDPHYRVIRYNSPPGQRNIDLTQLVSQRVASSPGILSPDKAKMVYTKSFFYPRSMQTASAAYYIPVNNSISDAYDALYLTNVMQGNPQSIFSVGMDSFKRFRYVTLFPIDWSKDSSKIAFKEQIGSNIHETWITNVIIYDFNSMSWKRLTAVREAIIYWWRQNKQIEINDYLWDIFPIGWDKSNPDRLIVYAYAFTKDNPLFLGTWSIDYNEEKSMLVSIDSTDIQIDLNGFGLKEIKMEN